MDPIIIFLFSIALVISIALLLLRRSESSKNLKFNYMIYNINYSDLFNFLKERKKKQMTKLETLNNL